MAKELTVTMTKEWPSPKCVWLEPGKEYTLDFELARLLMQLNRARFTGTADQLFK